jgi:hypothetical protein
MRHYSMSTADEALDAAFEAGALTVCAKHQYNVIRTGGINAKQTSMASPTRTKSVVGRLRTWARLQGAAA